MARKRPAHTELRTCIECGAEFTWTKRMRPNRELCTRDCYRNHRQQTLKTTPYPRVWYKGKRWEIHRLIWKLANPNEELLDTDIIHHVNENPFDRRPSNLEKLSDQAAHLQRHNYFRDRRRKSRPVQQTEDMPSWAY